MTPSAERTLRKLPRPAQQRMEPAITALGDNPRPAGAVLMATGGRRPKLWRIRIGDDFRVIYAIDDANRRIAITRIGLRNEAYDDLDTLTRAAARLLDEGTG